MPLNEDQEAVAQHRTGRAIALACPGSGKTSTITERTGRLISEGVNPANIIQLTFTNKARDEMRERLLHKYGDAVKKVFISNFHGLCGQVLRRFGKPIGYTDRMTIADSGDQEDLIKQIARKKYAALGVGDDEIGKVIHSGKIKTLAKVCNDMRESLQPPSSLEDCLLIDGTERWIVKEYLRVLRERDQCDFSGMLSEMVRLLKEVPDVRERLQKKFQWIQVDEYQDTNGAQNEIVELIAGPDDNVVAVGDIDQSVYGWRGAGGPKAIETFIQRGKNGCKLFKLKINYRSTPQIIKVASNLIQCSEKRESIDFEASRPDGAPVTSRWFHTPDDEANVVAGTIAELVGKGLPAKEIAVLFRLNDMSRPVEQQLARRSIPYKVVGGGSFYDRIEVKDALAFLRFLHNPKDLISFNRVANKPARGMGDVSVGMVEAYADERGLSVPAVLARPEQVSVTLEGKGKAKALPDAAVAGCRVLRDVFGFDASNRTPYEAISHMLNVSQYERWLKETYQPKDKNKYEERRRNLNELVNSIALFSRDQPDSSIGDYLQSIALYTEGDDEENENGVRLMSMHASKGKEFDVVFLVGSENGMCPHKRSVLERPDGEGMEEERRLYYVAMTRARKLLYPSFCMKRQDTRYRGGKWTPCSPSVFLVESGILAEEEAKAFANRAVKSV